METILETRDVRKEFVRPERTIEVLRGIDMKIPKGKFVALTGKSGCGKTTLLQLLGVLDNPSSGSILYKGKALSRLGVMKRSAFRLNEIGFIFQSYQLLPELSSLENVVLAGQLSGKSMSMVRERARTLLEDVKMTHRTNHRPAELSGGEQQRIAIARSLMNDPEVILADEPTGNLDANSAESIYQLIKTLNSELGTGFVVVTHDQHLANKLDRQLLMVSGILQGQD